MDWKEKENEKKVYVRNDRINDELRRKEKYKFI